MNLENIPYEGDRQGVLSDIYEWAESFLYPVLFFLVIFVFFFRPATVNGSSMVPTLHHGERLVLQQSGYNDPQYGDIIVVDRSYTDEDAIVKRVIGKAGDIIYIDFEKHEVWRNDTKLDEPYINEPTARAENVEFPVRVPKNCIFVMGDNRNNSLDSRDTSIGMIDVRRVMGKAVFRFFPFSKIGAIE